MKHYAGLDVSVKESAVCVVNEDGRNCWEMKIPSHPEDLASALGGPAYRRSSCITQIAAFGRMRSQEHSKRSPFLHCAHAG